VASDRGYLPPRDPLTTPPFLRHLQPSARESQMLRGSQLGGVCQSGHAKPGQLFVGNGELLRHQGHDRVVDFGHL
jgi:hypothetical protein